LIATHLQSYCLEVLGSCCVAYRHVSYDHICC
jgi:hypothetical protein